MYQDKSYAVGKFTLGCESQCECFSSGASECGERCKRPFRQAGQTRDPLCVEKIVDDEGCCAIVTCASEGIGLENDEYEYEYEEKEGPCANIKCGPNAECHHEVFRSDDQNDPETICVCNEGFTGDPDSDQGCRPDSRLPLRGEIGNNNEGVTDLFSHPVDLTDFFSPEATLSLHNANKKSGCEVNNQTHPAGAEWFDGCEYKCSCSEKREILCQPRCKAPPPPAETPGKCELRTDPEDDCCKVMYCPSPDDSDLQPVGLPFDGCVFKNKTYELGQRFYDGCEQQCQCMGYGDMVCLSRCPPTAQPAPGQTCYTLADVSDPCCNITVCDDPILASAGAQEVEKVKQGKESRIVNNPPLDKGEPIQGKIFNASQLHL